MNKFKILIPLLCFFTLAACQSVVQTNTSYMMIPPANATGPEIIILALNGAFCDPSLYTDLFQTLQNYSTTYKIWVGMPIFPGDFPSDLDTRFPETLAELKEQGANSTDIFVAGHSLGGFIAQDYLSQANVTGYKALILFGKFIKFQYKDPQINYPIPVLTIGGELDGLSKISRISMSYNQMLRREDGLGHIYYPVAIVPGAYHSSYITGALPQVLADVDIKPEATGPEVWAVCAKLVDAFINVNMNLENFNSSYGAKVLYDHIYGVTYDLMAPLLKAFAWEGNPYLYNASLINTTEWIALNILDQAGLQANQLQTEVVVEEVRNLSKFNTEKPDALYTNQVLNYTVYTHKDIGVVESDDISNPPNQSAIYIDTKFKSQTFIFDISSLEMDAATANASTCKMLNKKVIDDVMAIIPNKTMTRFMKWGVRLQAGDDIEYANLTSWEKHPAKYDDHWGYIDFKSARLETDVKVEFLGSHDAKGGDFFCKLLSPGKVAEWIYTDGLKRFDGAGSDNSTNSTQNASASTGAGLPAGFTPDEAQKSASLSHFGGN